MAHIMCRVVEDREIGESDAPQNTQTAQCGEHRSENAWLAPTRADRWVHLLMNEFLHGFPLDFAASLALARRDTPSVL